MRTMCECSFDVVYISGKKWRYSLTRMVKICKNVEKWDEDKSILMWSDKEKCVEIKFLFWSWNANIFHSE